MTTWLIDSKIVGKFPLVIPNHVQHNLLMLLNEARLENDPQVHTTRVGPSRMQLRRVEEEAVFPYYDRTDVSLDWYWIDHPIAKWVRDLVEPLYYTTYDFITRVSIQIHSHEAPILPHWDDGGFREDKWPINHQGWVIRIPITTMDNDAYLYDLHHAPFYAIINGVHYNMSADNHAFGYDERWILHGGEHRNHMRGMIGIYGMLKDKNKIPTTPMRITSQRPVMEWGYWKDYDNLYDDMYNRCHDLFGCYQKYLKFAFGETIFNKLMVIHDDRISTN